MSGCCCLSQFGGSSTSSSLSATGIAKGTINLTGVAQTLLTSRTWGNYTIKVIGAIEGSPSLHITASKVAATEAADFKFSSASPALDGRLLGIEWAVGAGIKISKDGASHDGTYKYLIVGIP